MKNMFSIFITLLASVLISSPVYSLELKPGDKREPRLPMKNITQAIETDSIEFDRGLDGKIDSVETRLCASCAVETFVLTPKTKVYLGSVQILLEDLGLYSGKSGTLVYYPETKELQSIHFFNLEDAQ